ncbi:MAG: chemotaxis protein CheX [Bdellovibrionales bacterium]|nr:chemotaxis protein CheX [Bdellovibrionales bacterium]
MGLFNYREHEGVVTVYCPEDLNQAAARELLYLSHLWIQSPAKGYVFEFTKTLHMGTSVIKPFVLLIRAMRKKGSHFFSVGISKDLEKLLVREGLVETFAVKRNVDEALRLAGVRTKPSQVKATFLSPFIDATLKTFGVQAEVQVTTGKIRVKQKTEKLTVDLAGVMNISSEAFRGAIAICFPAMTFVKIYAKMMGEERYSIGDEEFDAASELMNIIFGQAKADLENNQGIILGQALPTLIRGFQLELMQKSSAATMIIPFSTELGDFHIQINVEPLSEAGAGQLKTFEVPADVPDPTVVTAGLKLA